LVLPQLLDGIDKYRTLAGPSHRWLFVRCELVTQDLIVPLPSSFGPDFGVLNYTREPITDSRKSRPQEPAYSGNNPSRRRSSLGN
jgi:hypothetical protein